MEIFGIGITELLFIVIIVLIIFGPNDLVKNSKEIGKFLNKVLTSDAWRAMRQTTDEIKRIPTTLMREANLEEFQNQQRDLDKEMRAVPRFIGTENRIAPAAQPPEQPATNPQPPQPPPADEKN